MSTLTNVQEGSKDTLTAEPDDRTTPSGLYACRLFFFPKPVQELSEGLVFLHSNKWQKKKTSPDLHFTTQIWHVNVDKINLLEIAAFECAQIKDEY